MRLLVALASGIFLVPSQSGSLYDNACATAITTMKQDPDGGKQKSVAP